MDHQCIYCSIKFCYCTISHLPSICHHPLFILGITYRYWNPSHSQEFIKTFSSGINQIRPIVHTKQIHIGLAGSTTSDCYMNWKSRLIRATFATLFLGSLLILVTASIAPELILNGNAEAYAKEYSQSSPQTEECGNGIFSSNVFCSNQETQTQGDNDCVFNTAIQSSIGKTNP